MKKLTCTILASLVLLACFSWPAFAEGEKNYTSFKLGRYYMRHGGYDKPIGFEIAEGRMFTKNVGLELGYGRYELSRNDSGDRPAWLSLSQPALGHWKEYETLTISPLTLTLKAVSSNDYSVAFIGGGIGAYFLDYEARFKTKYEGSATFNDSDTLYGIHFETGIGYNTLENLYLGIGLRFIFTEATSMKKKVLGLDAGQEGRINGYTISGEVSYRF